MSIDANFDFIVLTIMILRYTYLELRYYIMTYLRFNLEIVLLHFILSNEIKNIFLQVKFFKKI